MSGLVYISSLKTYIQYEMARCVIIENKYLNEQLEISLLKHSNTDCGKKDQFRQITDGSNPFRLDKGFIV